jgi:hypothetical protein
VSDGCACPSGRCRRGSALIGVRTEEGLGYVTPPLPIDDDFIERVAQSGGAAEQRFRFSEPCIEQGCGQWTGDACGVIDTLLQAPSPPPASLPACGIRSRCRWFAQAGARACAVCPLVVTDNTASLRPIDARLGG